MTRLRILGGGATHGLVEKLRPGFEARTGCTIEATFGAVGAMKARLLAGEPADVMIPSRALIDELVREGQVVPSTVRDVATVETALAVRAGDAKPAIADKDGLRATLLAADAIHFPDPAQATAGIHFAKVIRELGIWSEVEGRLKAAANGATAMRALARSKARRPIGCTQATEIRATPGIVLVAPLPPGCNLTTVYAAAITVCAQAPAEAAAFIAHASQ